MFGVCSSPTGSNRVDTSNSKVARKQMIIASQLINIDRKFFEVPLRFLTARFLTARFLTAFGMTDAGRERGDFSELHVAGKL